MTAQQKFSVVGWSPEILRAFHYEPTRARANRRGLSCAHYGLSQEPQGRVVSPRFFLSGDAKRKEPLKPFVIVITALQAFTLIADEPKIIPELKSNTGSILLTNVQFSSVIGSRVTFKTDKGPKAFDVNQISADTLKELGIDQSEAIAKQEAIDAAKQKYQSASKTVAVAVGQQESKKWDQLKQDQAEAEKERQNRLLLPRKKHVKIGVRHWTGLRLNLK